MDTYSIQAPKRGSTVFTKKVWKKQLLVSQGIKVIL